MNNKISKLTNCFYVFCMQFSVALETVYSKIWFQKVKFHLKCFYFLLLHALIINVQYMIGSKRKPLSLLEKPFKIDSEHFVSDTVLNAQQLTTHLHVNQLLQNIMARPFITVRLLMGSKESNQTKQNTMRNK